MEKPSKESRLTLVKRNVFVRGKNRWFSEYKCVCGNMVYKRNDYRKNVYISCGCYNKELNKWRHDSSGIGLNKTLYQRWVSIKGRCYNKSDDAYKNYGGRGIIVCNEWKNSFKNFHKWATENGFKKELTIERINNNGNYEPSNCKWATRQEQAYNTRLTNPMEIKEKCYSLREKDGLTFDEIGRIVGKSGCRIRVIVSNYKKQIGILMFLLLSFTINAQTFSETINPYGEKFPIGGGIGYGNIVKISQASKIADTKDKLLLYLKGAESEEIIYIPDTCVFNFYTEKNIPIDKGVILASNRGEVVKGKVSEGAKLIHHVTSFDRAFDSFLVTGGEYAVITGLNISGITPDIGDIGERAMGMQTGIKANHIGLQVENCEIANFNKQAVWLAYSSDAWINHNYIHESRADGLGYAVWTGGTEQESDNVIIEGNIFSGVRHCVAASGRPVSYTARYNIIGRKQLYLNFDRHQYNVEGGKYTTIKNNLFFSNQQHYGLPYPMHPNGKIEITGNYFYKDSPAGYIDQTFMEYDQNKVIIKNNYYRESGRSLPVITMASPDSGTVPFKCTFKTTYADSYSLLRQTWDFGNGIEQTKNKSVTYKFTKPGIYDVTTIAYNLLGIPSDALTKTIKVKPKTGRYVLSMWIKDSYNGTLTGKYEKQITFDNKVIWKKDCAGNDGWQQVIINLDSLGIVFNSKHTVSFRLASKSNVTNKEVAGIRLYADAFYVFNTTIANSGFENADIFPWKVGTYNATPPPVDADGGSSIVTTSEDFIGGVKSMRMGWVQGNDIIYSGRWTEIYQILTFK